MAFFEALYLFNLWGEPVLKPELPSELTHYYVRKSDSVLTHRITFRFLSDTLVQASEWDSILSTGEVWTEDTWWGLRPDKRISWLATKPSDFKTATRYLKFEYAADTLKSTTQYHGDTAKGFVHYTYADGQVLGRTSGTPGKKDSTSWFYEWSGGRIAAAYEDYGSVKYKRTFIYEGGKPVRMDRTVILGASSGGRMEYHWEGGRLARYEDYDIDRLTGLYFIRYEGGSSLRLRGAGPPVQIGGHARDALGRAREARATSRPRQGP